MDEDDWARRMGHRTAGIAAVKRRAAWVFSGNRVAPGGQEHMLSDEAANVQRLIGKLHRAGERAAGRLDMRVGALAP